MSERIGKTAVFGSFWLLLLGVAPLGGQSLPEVLSGAGSTPGRVNADSMPQLEAIEFLLNLLPSPGGASRETSTTPITLTPWAEATRTARTASPTAGAPGSVSAVATALSALGYEEAGSAAIRAFQRDRGLAVDGVAGPMTLDALIARLSDLRGGGGSESPRVEALDRPACPEGEWMVRGECAPVTVPENGTLNAAGNGWVCRPGFRVSSGACEAIRIPSHARLNDAGTGWVCDSGYRYLAGRCRPIPVPVNGELNSSGTGWRCQTGFIRRGNRCVADVDP